MPRVLKPRLRQYLAYKCKRCEQRECRMSSWTDQQWRPRCQRHLVRRNILRCKGESGEPCVHGVPSRKTSMASTKTLAPTPFVTLQLAVKMIRRGTSKVRRVRREKPAFSTTMPLRSSYVGGNTSRYKQECGEHVRVALWQHVKTRKVQATFAAKTEQAKRSSTSRSSRFLSRKRLQPFRTPTTRMRNFQQP